MATKRTQRKKWKIGIFGSVAGSASVNTRTIRLARQLGKELARRGCIVINGACEGLPYEVAHAARAHGAQVWGFAPAQSYTQFRAKYKAAPNTAKALYTKLIYIPRSFTFMHLPGVPYKYRNVTSTAHCDAGILIGGRMGTVNEFSNLSDFGKVIGALTGTGGTADAASRLWKTLRKKNVPSVVVSHRDSARLIKGVIAELTKRQKEKSAGRKR